MALPFAFLIGLLVVVAHREVGAALPGEGTSQRLVLAATALLAPVVLAALAWRSARRALVTARRPFAPPRALLRLSVLAAPLSLHVLFAEGAYGDWIDRLAPTSHAVRAGLALLPLYAVEMPRIFAATMAEALLEVDLGSRRNQPVAPSLLPRWPEVWPLVRLRLGWPLLALLPAAMLGVGMDVVQLDRALYVLLLVTSFGATGGAATLLLTAAVLLPPWFRVAFGTRALPEPQGTPLRALAAALGFPPRRVVMLPTGMRGMNAMMVGPLPVGRVLCLTDGILATLDGRSLSGVLAHEIGHARMGHPGVLMVLAVVLPLLLLAPLRGLDLADVDPFVQALGALAVMAVVWLVVRSLARRFEHEADVASVQALGAEPCSRALALVSHLTHGHLRGAGRLLSIHPDERERIAVMQRYELDASFRARFDRRTRTLRLGVVGLAAVALGVAAWSWRDDWRYERAIVDFYCGDFVGARAAMAEAGEVPARWLESWRRLEEELTAALELAPEARDWAAAQQAIVPAAFERGERVLLASGPAAARPWFALAVSFKDAPSVTERAIHDYCEAAADRDPELVARLVHIVARLGPPPALAPVFRDER